MPVTIGAHAPNFTLPDTDKKPISLTDFSGKKVIIVFYPGAFTGVCTKEMCTFRDSMSQFNSYDAQVIGISVDAPFSNKAFAAQNGIVFPLLSDYTRAVAKQYCGVYDNFAGLQGYAAAKRSVFVLDTKGTVVYQWISDNPGVEPPYDEVKKALS